MFNFEGPITSDPIVRIHAMEIVLRSMLSTMTPEQLAKTRRFATRGAEIASENPSLTPANQKMAEEVIDMVRFLFAHISD